MSSRSSEPSSRTTRAWSLAISSWTDWYLFASIRDRRSTHRAHGELAGTLAMYSATPRRFSSDTQRLVRLYAAQAAIAIGNARLLTETHRLARDDYLTGVLNRRSLMERLDGEMAEAARHGDNFAVAMCDVDGLKSVNDTAGHLAGNEVAPVCCPRRRS